MVLETVKLYGRLDCAFNNAVIFKKTKKMEGNIRRIPKIRRILRQNV
jgi:hypothetical protein